MYRIDLRVLAAVMVLPLSTTAAAQSGAEIIDRMIDAEAGYYAGIENLYQVSRTMGHRVPEYFEQDGGYLRLVPLPELMERQQPNELTNASPAQLKDAANRLRMESGRVDAAMNEELAKSGLAGSGVMGPIIHMASDPPDPWLTSSPGGMMRLYATMLDASADAKVAMDAEKASHVERNMDNDQMVEMLKSRTRVYGRSNFQGYDVIEVGADNLDLTQDADGGSFTMNSVRILVDADLYLPRQMRFQGVLEQPGEKPREMTIERTDSVFSGGENCGDLKRPRKSAMRLAGALSASEQAELEAARQQLAGLPPEQLEMMKQMMGREQFEMLENMTAGTGIEIVSDVLELRCNTNPPTAEDIAAMFR